MVWPMRGPKQTGFERTLSIVSLLVVLAALAWIVIERGAIWPLSVTSFALALNPLSQLHYERRLGRPGRSSYFLFVGMVTLGLFQLFLLGMDGSPGWVPVMTAGIALIAVVVAVIVWKKVLRDRQLGQPFSPEPQWPTG